VIVLNNYILVHKLVQVLTLGMSLLYEVLHLKRCISTLTNLNTCFCLFQTHTVFKWCFISWQDYANMTIFRTTLGLLLILSVTCPSIAQKTSDNISTVYTTRLSTSARTFSKFIFCFGEWSPSFIFIVQFS